MSTSIHSFLREVRAVAESIGIERRFDDGIWWRLVPRVDEVQCLFVDRTACFGGEMICALSTRQEELRDWISFVLKASAVPPGGMPAVDPG